MAGGNDGRIAFSERIRSHLSVVLASPMFAGSARLSAFLGYIVEQSLQGKDDEIKEYLIATNVYDRRAGYDPQTDSIVRVEASRLRKKLNDFYEGPGKLLPLRIELPRGSYRPQFVEVPVPAEPSTPDSGASAAKALPGEAPAGPPPRVRRRQLAVAVFSAAILCGLLYWGYSRVYRGGSASFAVLPFVNLTGHGDEESFCDGLTEELTARLAAPNDLRVLARTTMSAYKGKAVDLARVGSEKGIAYFLEGSVRRVGVRYLITMQLISSQDGYHVWAETYERAAGDPLTLQRALAAEAAKQIRQRTLGQAAWRSKGRTPPSGAALEAFLAAGALMKRDIRQTTTKRGLPPEIEQALERLQFAVRVKPDFTEAWVYLAQAYELCADYDPSRTAEFIAKGKEAARQAIASDETVAEGYASLATLELFRDLDPKRAEISFRRAVDLQPRDARLMRVYGDALRIVGKPAEAMAEVNRAIAMAPDEKSLLIQKALLLYAQGDGARAVEILREPLAAQPPNEEAHWLHALVLEDMGRYAEAESILRAVLARRPRDTRALPALGNLLGVMGKRTEALQVAGQTEQLVANGLVREYGVALIYGGLKENVKALDWLERAYDHKDPSIVYLMVENRLASLRNEPRMLRIAARLGILPTSSN